MLNPNEPANWNSNWHIDVLCIIFEMSLEELMEMCDPLPTEKIILDILQKMVAEKVITARQFEILEELSGKHGPQIAPHSIRTQVDHLTNLLSGSREFLRLVGVL